MRSDTRKLATSLVILPFLLVFFACQHDSTSLDTSTLSFAKGGNKDKDGGAHRDIDFGLYEVEMVPNTGQGFTPVQSVNEAVYEYLSPTTETTRLFFENRNDPVELAGGPEGYFGCPNPFQPCNQVTLHFTGSAFTLGGGMANMVVGCGLGSADPDWGCMNDFTDLDVRRLASTAGGSTFPSIPWELLEDAIVTDELTGERSFTYYWQGQRGIRHREVAGTEKIRGKTRTTYTYTELWDYLPDLHTVGYEETPVFSFGARLSSSNGATYFTAWTSYRRDENCTFEEDDCRGFFKGVQSADPLYMWIDLWDLDNTGRLEFAIQAFTVDPVGLLAEGASTLNYADLIVLGANPKSHSRVMMVPPGGPRTMLNATNGGRRGEGYSYKLGVAETQYVVDLTTVGCYEFHALSLVANEDNRGEWEESFEINRKVWVPGVDSDQVFHVVYDGQSGSSMALGSCPTPLP